RVQRLLDAHKSAFHTTAETPPNTSTLPTFAVPTSLYGQLQMLLSLRNKKQQLTAAQQAAQTSSENIDRKHDELEKTLAQTASAPVNSEHSVHIAQMAALERLAEQKKLLTDFDRRQQDQQQLVQVYGNWITLLDARRMSTLNGILRSVLFVLL